MYATKSEVRKVEPKVIARFSQDKRSAKLSISKRLTKSEQETKSKEVSKKEPVSERSPRKAASKKPPVELPSLEIKLTSMVSADLHSATSPVREYERIHSPPRPPLPSGRTKLPPLWPDQQERIRRMLSLEDAIEEAKVARVEIAPPEGMIVTLIQPLKPVRARRRYVRDEVNKVARVTAPVERMTSETQMAVPIETGLPKRIARWFNRISKKEIRRSDRTATSISSAFTLTDISELQSIVGTTRGSLASFARENEPALDQAAEEAKHELPWKKARSLEANHRLITDELRLDLLLKRLRMQLNTRDLVEVMIDLHTGRASKKTKEFVESAYATLKDQK